MLYFDVVIISQCFSLWSLDGFLDIACHCCDFSDRLRSSSMENVGKLQISPDKVSVKFKWCKFADKSNRGNSVNN